jgi:dipeptidyl aminopeptidase/acylaminoacyl peptidase
MRRPSIHPLGLAGLALLLAGLACTLGVPTPPPALHTPPPGLTPQISPTPPVESRVTPTPGSGAPTATPAGSLTQPGPWLVTLAPGGTSLSIFDYAGGSAQVAAASLLDPSDLTAGAAASGGWLAVRTAGLTLSLLHLPDGRFETLAALLPPGMQVSAPGAAGDVQMAVSQPGSLSWSPDGRYLAFVASIDGPSADLYLFDAGSRRIHRLTSGPYQPATPSWSPDGLWVAFQEVETFQPTWKSTVVWAAATDHAEVRKLYLPPAGGNGEVFLGWTAAGNLVSYTRTAPGSAQGADLRAVPISARYVERIFNGAFASAALDPRDGLVAFTEDEHSAPAAGLSPGLYLLPEAGGKPTLVRAGLWSHLLWSPVDRHFYASSGSGVLSVAANGNTVLLDHESSAAPSPDGQWLAAWGGAGSVQPGLRLYTPSGQFLQEISSAPVDALVWRPDSRGLFFIAGGKLQRADFPQVQARALDPASSSGMVWVFP